MVRDLDILYLGVNERNTLLTYFGVGVPTDDTVFT